MASQFPAGAAAGDIFTTGAGDTYQFMGGRWLLSSENDVDPTFDIYSRVNALKWGTNALVYENVFDAIADGTIYEYGGAWNNDTTYASTLWNGANILELNRTVTDPLVASTAVVVPAGYSMVWLRVLNEGAAREIWLDMYFDPNNATGSPTSGTFVDEECHYAENTHPDRLHPYNSSMGPNRHDLHHVWHPFALHSDAGGTAYFIARNHAVNTADYWISGVALTANPWGFSRTQARTSFNGVRIGSVGGTATQKPTWFGSFEGVQLASRGGSSTATSVVLRHTIVDNGVDKVIHVIGCGDISANFRPMTPLFVNGTKVDAIPSCLDPFSWHVANTNLELSINSYKVPASLLSLRSKHAKLEFQANSVKNNTFYYSQIMSCDLRA
ncbi:MAG: hypothetical protein ACO22S_04040 [Burkholderiaceae bacterium]